MKLVDYYKKVLGVLGLHTTDDDFITIDEKGESVWINGGKSLVLPTKEHINTLIDIDDDGKPTTSKIIYNPLDENVIRGDSVSIKKTKEAGELKLSHAVNIAGNLLLMLATLKKHQNVPMYIQSFLAGLKDVVTTANMVAVDEKSIENWNKLYSASHKQNVGIVKIFLKKGGIDSSSKKFNRLATMKFPLYEQIVKGAESKTVLGVTLRNKDIKVFKLLYEFLFKSSELSKMEFGSNDGESPAFISLMSLYVIQSKYPSKVINALKFVDQELADSGYININMTAEDMDVSSMFSKELIGIPTSLSVSKSLESVKNKVSANTINPMANQRDYVSRDMTPDTYTPITSANNANALTVADTVTPEDKNASIINSILYGNGGGFNNSSGLVPTQQVQNMVLPQNAMTTPVSSVPMGIDSVPQQQPYGYAQSNIPPMGVNMMQQQSAPMGLPIQQSTYTGGVYQPNQAMYNPMG